MQVIKVFSGFDRIKLSAYCQSQWKYTFQLVFKSKKARKFLLLKAVEKQFRVWLEVALLL